MHTVHSLLSVCFLTFTNRVCIFYMQLTSTHSTHYTYYTTQLDNHHDHFCTRQVKTQLNVAVEILSFAKRSNFAA